MHVLVSMSQSERWRPSIHRGTPFIIGSWLRHFIDQQCHCESFPIHPIHHSTCRALSCYINYYTWIRLEVVKGSGTVTCAAIITYLCLFTSTTFVELLPKKTVLLSHFLTEGNTELLLKPFGKSLAIPRDNCLFVYYNFYFIFVSMVIVPATVKSNRTRNTGGQMIKEVIKKPDYLNHQILR